jgi:predicted MFS family arabinose efflux permease
MNLDHGIIPASTKEIKEDLNIGDTQLGILGSLVYCGVVIAGFFASKVYILYPSKQILVLAIICLIATLIAFSYAKNIFLLYFIRLLTGCFQVFMLIYFPVWVDVCSLK